MNAEPITHDNGLTTTVTAVIEDFDALGWWWSRLESIDQARFLAGVVAGFRAMEGVSRWHQLHYIAEAVGALPERDRSQVRLWVDELNAYLSSEVAP